MTPKPRFPLTTKILLLALLNLILLTLALGIVLRVQLAQEFQSFLLATGREHVLAVSRQIALELQDTPDQERTRLLNRYSDTYRLLFLLANNRGEIVAGPPLTIPPEVADRLRRFPALSGPLSRGAANLGVIPLPPFLLESEGPYPYWIAVRIPLHNHATNTTSRATLFLVSRTFWTNPFFFDPDPWLLNAALALIITVVCWLPMVRAIAHAVRRMTQATAQIAEGHFDVQAGNNRSDELGILGASIDRMSARLSTLVNGQKRFLGDVAHELRSPLGRMQVALSILDRRAEDEKDKRYVADLVEEVETMSRLTDELLAFAKAELRPETVQFEPVDVAAVVRDAIEAETDSNSMAEIRCEIESDVRVLANRDLLARALSNLIRNAIRYAGAAGPVTISARREGAQRLILVADSGPGVPEQALERIFEPFFRLDKSRDRRSGGTGLGLAIVRSCIEASGGSVEARNRQPSGLEVSIRLRAA